MKFATCLILVLAVTALLLIAGCTQQQQPVQQTLAPAAPPTAVPSADTVRATAGTPGTVLTDAQGRTLYYFANDRADSGASACSGQCAALWPAFSAGTVTVSSPLDPADFGSITRADGTKQTTYYGWPLYYYSGDAAPGDVKGDGVLGIWFVFRPDESVLVAHTPALGSYLTDTAGKTLYVFTKDTATTTACSGTCLAKWPAFAPDYPLKVPSSLNLADFAPLARTDNVTQTAYKGQPLYYYSGDNAPGDTKGQGFNNLWYVANVSGVIPVVTTVPTTVPTPNYATSYGGMSSSGGGY